MQEEISRKIRMQLEASIAPLQAMWKESFPVKHFFLDDVLDSKAVTSLAASFPHPETLMLRDSIRERKRVGIDLSQYDPIIGACLLAFQDSGVLETIERITGMRGLEADPQFYASGISVMGKGDFLNPHLDNSHNEQRDAYRVLNVLFYCSPDWALENGGNLELWDRGVTNGHTIVSRFNRLVVMATDNTSWHSVSQVQADAARYCVSNYYFSKESPANCDYSHVTTFTGRPEERLKGMILKVDGIARNAIRRVFPKGIIETKHKIMQSGDQ